MPDEHLVVVLPVVGVHLQGRVRDDGIEPLAHEVRIELLALLMTHRDVEGSRRAGRDGDPDQLRQHRVCGGGLDIDGHLAGVAQRSDQLLELLFRPDDCLDGRLALDRRLRGCSRPGAIVRLRQLVDQRPELENAEQLDNRLSVIVANMRRLEIEGEVHIPNDGRESLALNRLLDVR